MDRCTISGSEEANSTQWEPYENSRNDVHINVFETSKMKFVDIDEIGRCSFTQW
jgi:hypothetical protein